MQGVWVTVTDITGDQTIFPADALARCSASGTHTQIFLKDGAIIEVAATLVDFFAVVNAQLDEIRSLPGESNEMVMYPVLP